MPATKSPQNFTGAERLIAMIADFVLRNKLDDAAFASLGRLVFQQYIADVNHLVAETDREISEAVERCEAEFRAHVARTPNHQLSRNGGVQ